MDFTQLLTRKYSESNSNDHLHTEFVQTKFQKAPFALITIISLYGS